MNQAIFAELLTVAKKLNNYAENATGGGLWTSTTEYRATVPAGKRWFVQGGCVNRDVSSTMNVNAYDASDDLLFFLDFQGAATGTTCWPNTQAVAVRIQFPKNGLMLDAGEYILITLAVAQGVGAFANCVILEVDV